MIYPLEEYMEQTTEQTARLLISQLKEQLARHEDAETAIDVYKSANWIVSQLEQVKSICMDLAEQDMEQRDLHYLRAPEGSAGWTEPKIRMLDETAWLNAISQNPELRRIQREYDQAEARLEQAQEPYMQLPEERFFIR